MPTSSPSSENGQSATSNDPAYAPLVRGPSDLRSFLKTAVRATSALTELHGKDTIHRNIRRTNIIVHAETGEVRLIGMRDTYAATEAQKSADPSESLPYTSPEQTEGMKRPVDHRADLYSLGITLYEHLTGTLPFQAEDPLGWVQAHLTKQPRDPREVVPGTPDAVADILLKLMNKTVEERYQSARGLLIDLETCLVELEAKGRIEPFPLGARDVWHGLRISAKLYGREKESAELLAAFDRVLATGSREIALVSGYSGVGKSSLVQEMHKPIVRERGFFLAGKFDQHKRNIPYVTISQAFREVVRQILGESEAQIQSWKERILEALGANAQLIIDVIPQVEQIIGKQRPVAPLPLSDAQNRFNHVFRSFIGIFAKKEHPLALFLDDLQYADSASLALIHYLLARTDAKHFFVLGAYRDNEVSATHPFIMTLDEMRKENVRITSLVLKPLNIGDLTQLVADTFHCDSERAGPLAKLLHAKTGGNPFFANQFLAELHHENLVHFDVDKASWHWSIQDIETKQFTDDVVELMADKLRRLPGETQAALQLAACIGSEFDVEMLEMTHDKTPEETYQDLDHAVRAEFMLRRGNTYKFLHDRVHQAAYSLIPEEQRSWVHLRVGRLLLERTPEAERDERSFDIVNQFNIGQAYITDPDERHTIARLNLTAGRKAKASVAYQSATMYLTAGKSLLNEDSWASDYDLTLGIIFALAECEYLSGNFDECDLLCASMMEHAASLPDKAAIVRLQIRICIAKTDNAKGVKIGLEGLKLLGMEIPTAPSPADVGAEISIIQTKREGRNIEELLGQPEATDPIQIALMETIDALALASYYSDQNLFTLLMCRLVNLSIDHGNTGASTLGYVTFGFALGLIFNDTKSAFSYGKLAYDLAEKHEYVAFKAQVCNVFASMITIWSHHVRMHIETSKIGFRAGIESGSIMLSCFNRFQITLGRLFQGDPLDEVLEDCKIGNTYVRSVKFMFVADNMTLMQRFTMSMVGLTDRFASFTSEGFTEEDEEKHVTTASIPMVQFCFHLFTMQARFLAGELERAMEAYEKGKGLIWTCTGQLPVPEFTFYSALVASGLFNAATKEKQGEYRELLSASEVKLRGWAEGCPENFGGKHLLVAAEIARIDEKAAEAARFYDEAILAFKKSGFVHNEAISNELASRFYVGQDAEKAAAYLREARSCYARWGALGKVKHLEAQHPAILAN